MNQPIECNHTISKSAFLETNSDTICNQVLNAGSSEKPASLFKLGQLTVSESVLNRVSLRELFDVLARFHQGDWGDVTDVEHDCNELALSTFAEIFARYHIDESTLTLMTTPLRNTTSVYSEMEY